MMWRLAREKPGERDASDSEHPPPGFLSLFKQIIIDGALLSPAVLLDP
jgi:hypothetical protein